MSSDPLDIFKDALNKARLEGYNYAMNELLKFIGDKTGGITIKEITSDKVVEDSTNLIATPIDEVPEGEPDPKDFIAPPPPKVTKAYCPECFALKTHCVCKGTTYDCNCGECDCMKPVRTEEGVCKECRAHA